MRLNRQMKNDEQDIIKRILSGKTDDFAYFLDTYGQQVFNLIVRIVRCEYDAEELTQDTFMKCFENLSSFNAKSSFSTWLYKIAYNTAISFTRKKEPEINIYDENNYDYIREAIIQYVKYIKIRKIGKNISFEIAYKDGKK